MVENTDHVNAQVLELYATVNYMLGSVILYPLRLHDLSVEIIEDLTLCRI